jgi:23S rRNA G2445 N2-methylase RlmL
MSHKPISLFARTIRGIESIAAAEIEQRCGAAITEVRHREIRFQLDALKPGLLDLGSVDDVFLTCGVINEVDHTRAALAALAKRSNQINFAETVEPLRHIRKIPDKPNFDVVASFLGRRNYNRFEIEDTVAGVIRHQTRWEYTPQRERQSNLDLSFRIHLSDQEAIIGVRLTSAPLHRRTYKTESRTGTLHPPLAFAMAMLSNLAENQKLLDPFCGVGTILIEALTLEPRLCASGVDIDSDSTRKAISIAETANKDIQFIVGDAGQLPFAGGEIDRIISNPPWGRAVGVRGTAQASFFDEVKRVSAAGVRIVLLLNAADEHQASIEQSGFELLQRTPVSLFGSWPEILVLEEVSYVTPERRGVPHCKNPHKPITRR